MTSADDIIQAFQQRMTARVAEIKMATLAWLVPRYDDAADEVNITRALLEIALDRHVALHDAGGFGVIEVEYQRALARQRGPVQ